MRVTYYFNMYIEYYTHTYTYTNKYRIKVTAQNFVVHRLLFIFKFNFPDLYFECMRMHYCWGLKIWRLYKPNCFLNRRIYIMRKVEMFWNLIFTMDVIFKEEYIKICIQPLCLVVFLASIYRDKYNKLHHNSQDIWTQFDLAPDLKNSTINIPI